MYHWAAREFNPGLVLDLGCELGVGARLMQSENREIEILNCDVDLSALKASQRHLGNPDLHLLQVDGEHIPLAAHSLSGACAIHVLHLVECPGDVIREIYRVLEPGGKYILSVPLGQLPPRWNPDSITTTLDNYLRMYFHTIRAPDIFRDTLRSDYQHERESPGSYLRYCLK